MLKPIGKRMIIEFVNQELKTKSGIILKDSSSKQEIIKAKVIEVSSEIKEISKGDFVYFSEYRVDKIKYNDIEYGILELENVLAKEID